MTKQATRYTVRYLGRSTTVHTTDAAWLERCLTRELHLSASSARRVARTLMAGHTIRTPHLTARAA